MKTLNRFAPVSIILLAMVIVISSCKKDAEDPDPTFTMSSDTVILVGGGTGLQFFAKCTNNGVKMTNVTITTPQDSLYIHTYNGASYDKNALIPLQGTNQAYPKRIGTWKFNLTGNSAGGKAFVYDATIPVSK